MALLRALWLFLWPLLGLGMGGFDLREDTTASVGPDQWFVASDHSNWLEAVQYVDVWQGCCDLHCVDVFSASEAIAKAFKRRHYKALSWDIKLSTAMDIVTRSGWYDLLQLCLRLLPFGMLAAGPPCSLFIWLSCSVHKRHLYGPAGDQSVPKVALANIITENLATLIRVVMRVRFLQVVVEQPKSSVMFTMPTWVAAGAALKFECVETFMGCFNHFMMKPTVLYGSMLHLSMLCRSLNQKQRDSVRKKIRSNLEKLEKKLGQKVVLVQRKGKSVSGGKDLGLSASYTASFASAVFEAWFKAWVFR